MYFHRKLKVLLSVHVGDFKLAGVGRHLLAAWKLMNETGLKLDELQPFGQYLVCAQPPVKLSQQQVNEMMELISALLTARGCSTEESADGAPPPKGNTSKGQVNAPQASHSDSGPSRHGGVHQSMRRGVCRTGQHSVREHARSKVQISWC